MDHPAAHKYTPEQLEAEIARPKRKGGRPRKYATDEERKKAHVESARRTYWRRKNAQTATANDVALALRKPKYETDEERHLARLESKHRYNEAHLEAYRLNAAACGYRSRH